jgi:hypothetical protein
MHRRIFYLEELHVVGIELSFTLPEVLLDFPFELFTAPLDVLAAIIGRITQVAAYPALHFLGGAFHLVLEASFV